MPRFFPPPGLFQDPKTLFEQMFPQQTIAGGMEGVAGEPGPTIGQILGNLYPGPEAQIMGLAVPLVIRGADPRISKLGKILIDKAEKMFGLTDDVSRAGFLLPEGQFLDFGGGEKIVGLGARTRYHRDIEQVLPNKARTTFAQMPEGGKTRGMQFFQKQTNSIRLGYHRGDMIADIVRPPTTKQVQKLLNTVEEMGVGRVFVDVNLPNNEIIHKQFMFQSELRDFLLGEVQGMFKK